MMAKRQYVGAWVALACLMAGTSAQAEEETNVEKDRKLKTQEVGERQHEGYTPQGVSAGSFLIFPKLEVSEGFSDNLFFEQSRHREDFYTDVVPSVLVRSNWSSHGVEAFIQDQSRRYNRFDSENVDNTQGYLSGRLDVVRGAFLTAKVGWDDGHESRSSPDDAGGLEPAQIRSRIATLGGEWQGGRIRLKLDGSAIERSFGNVETSSGTVINNHDRDRLELDGGLRGEYEIVPSYAGFVEARANQRNYHDSVDDNGYNRDSHGNEVRVGTALAMTGVLRGDVYGSYLWQQYDDARLEDISGPGAGAALTWTPTGLTTVKLGLTRTIQETTSRNASGAVQTKLESSVEHELRRNIILTADGSAAQSIYDNIGRHDKTWVMGGGVVYKLNRNFYTGLDYHYSHRDSSLDGNDYTENAAMVHLGTQF